MAVYTFELLCSHHHSPSPELLYTFLLCRFALSLYVCVYAWACSRETRRRGVALLGLVSQAVVGGLTPCWELNLDPLQELYKFFKIYFYYFVCLHLCSVHVLGVRGDREPPCGCWELSLGLSQEQEVPLTTELTLQPSTHS